MYKIRYLKTKEEFELVVPDVLSEGESKELIVRISDYDLFMLIRGTKPDIDDDTYLGIKKLGISVSLLKQAKTKAHLRRLNRADTSWVEISKRKKRGMSEERKERLEYLRENYDGITSNCVKHDWYNEFKSLCKDLGYKDAKERWEEAKCKFCVVK